MHGRMQAQLAEKHARDEAEEVMKEAQAELRARHGARLDAWRAGKKVALSASSGNVMACCDMTWYFFPIGHSAVQDSMFRHCWQRCTWCCAGHVSA